jgi:hypothetical protein
MDNNGLTQEDIDAWTEASAFPTVENGKLLVGLRHTWEAVDLSDEASREAEIERLRKVLDGIDLDSAIKKAFQSFWDAQYRLGYIADQMNDNDRADELYLAREALLDAWIKAARLIDAERTPLGTVSD